MKNKNLQLIARRIANAWGFDDDTENLFPERTLGEAQEDAASEARDCQPKKTLRDRQYGDMPLMVRPEYHGDFLDKLREQVYKNKSAENLKDVDGPDDMTKYMPEVIPKDLTVDEFEINHPDGPNSGYNVLKEYNDRGWDEDDAPEISEDKGLIMRDRSNNFRLPLFKKASLVKNVLAKFFMKVTPSYIEMDCQQVRVAKVLRDFESSLIYTKPRIEKGVNKGGWRKPDISGVRAMIQKAEPEKGLFTFQTGTQNYTTIFEFIPQGKEINPNKLQVRVTCSCPSWLFWGAQFNSVIENYHYGEIRPVYAPPNKRDPYKRFLVCKHVLACSRLIARHPGQFSISSIPLDQQKSLQKEPPIKIKIDRKIPKEKIKIPTELKHLARRPEISRIVKQWPTMNDIQKKEFIDDLPDANSVAFFA